MADFFPEISDSITDFIVAQHMFFVATAPKEGRINLSPKGMDTFRVIDPNTVAYLDLTGSGNETAAHLAHDTRITLMFCSFSKKTKILRLYGDAKVVRRGHEGWGAWAETFPPLPGARQVIVVTIDSIQASCGYAVPVYDFVEERQVLRKWAENKGEEGVEAYRQEKNLVSIDGALVYPETSDGETL